MQSLLNNNLRAAPENETEHNILDLAGMSELSRTFIPTGDPKDVDLNSKSATTTLPLKFAETRSDYSANIGAAQNSTSTGTPVNPGTGVYEEDIILFTSPCPTHLCMELKRWNFEGFCDPSFREEGVVRVEYLALDKLDDHMAASRNAAPRFRFGTGSGLPRGQKAWLLILPYVASTPGFDFAYSVFAVIVPGDDNIRWFYNPFTVGPLLTKIFHATPEPSANPDSPPAFQGSLILHHTSFSHSGPTAKHHQRFLTFAREMFTAATTFPDSPDWKNAVLIGDYCPPIRDPAEARGKLERCEFLHFARSKQEAGLVVGEMGLEISDDRYLERLHEVERGVAAMVGMKCAEYLFIKRVFFKDFYEEVYRSDKASASMRMEEGGDGHIVPADTATRATTGLYAAEISTGINTPASMTATSSPAPSTGSATPAPGIANGRRSTRPRADTPMTISNIPAATPATNQALNRSNGQANRRKFVRTDHAHQVWLERNHGMRHTKAKMLVVAWRELGFLDEAWFVGWIRKGGVLADGEVGGQVRQ